jgi:hypothetical protein
MMNSKLSLSTSLSTLALLAAFGTSVHAAQTPHDWIPAGEGIADETVAPSTASSTTRAAVKAETLQARRHGELIAAGEASGEHEQRLDESRPSRVTRSEVKAETLAAVHNGTIAPFGEAATFGGE